MENTSEFHFPHPLRFKFDEYFQHRVKNGVVVIVLFFGVIAVTDNTVGEDGHDPDHTEEDIETTLDMKS